MQDFWATCDTGVRSECSARFWRKHAGAEVRCNSGTIPHFIFGVDHFHAATLEARLREQGLDPQKDSDSFHVRDPDGLNVQVGDRGLGMSLGIVKNSFKMK